MSFWEGGAGMDAQCGGGVGGEWGWDGCTVWGWCWGIVGLGWVHSVGMVLGESGAGMGAQCGGGVGGEWGWDGCTVWG